MLSGAPLYGRPRRFAGSSFFKFAKNASPRTKKYATCATFLKNLAFPPASRVGLLTLDQGPTLTAPMEFDFTPEQIQLRKSSPRICRAGNPPARPRMGRRRNLSARGHQDRPASSVSSAPSFPEELGGAGLGYIEYAIIIEELSRVDPSVGLIVAAHNSLCTNHIFRRRQRRAAPQVHSRSSPRANGSAAGR